MTVVWNANVGKIFDEKNSLYVAEACLQQCGVVFESNLKKVATDGINDRVKNISLFKEKVVNSVTQLKLRYDSKN